MLFQDVDIVWYKNPLEVFHDKNSPIHFYDMYYQDDGSHSTRYAPFAPNSGFYFVRHNDKTRHMLTSLLMSGDVVLKTFSHQQAMTAVLAEHASLFGLRVKVFSRDGDEFPGGYHFHRRGGAFLREMYEGKRHPYLFHMSWTKNKDNKLLFLKQMGEWYDEPCLDGASIAFCLSNDSGCLYSIQVFEGSLCGQKAVGHWRGKGQFRREVLFERRYCYLPLQR